MMSNHSFEQLNERAADVESEANKGALEGVTVWGPLSRLENRGEYFVSSPGSHSERRDDRPMRIDSFDVDKKVYLPFRQIPCRHIQIKSVRYEGKHFDNVLGLDSASESDHNGESERFLLERNASFRPMPISKEGLMWVRRYDALIREIPVVLEQLTEGESGEDARLEIIGEVDSVDKFASKVTGELSDIMGGFHGEDPDLVAGFYHRLSIDIGQLSEDLGYAIGQEGN